MLDKETLMRQTESMTNTHTDGWDGELTNTCTCTVYDMDTDENTPSEYCYGDCWEDAVHLFHTDIKEWWDANPTYDWQVDGLPLWNRSVSGTFTAKNIRDFIRGITVDAEWRLCYKLADDCLQLNLAHHDVPMGRSFSVRYHEGDE